MTSLIGPNGAGKSTLLSAICRLIRFDEGEVKIDGQLMSDYKTMICRKDIDFKANEPYRNEYYCRTIS